jgi:Flp pilus assembly protein TadB
MELMEYIDTVGVGGLVLYLLAYAQVILPIVLAIWFLVIMVGIRRSLRDMRTEMSSIRGALNVISVKLKSGAEGSK